MSAVQPKNYSLSDFKSRALNLAQTSLYQLTIVPPKSIFSNTEYISLLCTEASLPGSSLATHDVTNDYHGVTEKMAYRRMYDDTINLTFYVDRSYNVIKFFEGWINFISGQGTTFSESEYSNPYVFYRMNYPQEYKTKLHIVKFEKDHHKVGRAPLPAKLSSKDVLGYEFVQAFPINITSMPFSYSQSEILKCSVSFSFIRYVVNKTLGSTNTPINNNNPGNPESQNDFGFDPNLNFYTQKQIPINTGNIDLSKFNTFRADEYYNNFGFRDQDATNTANFFGAA